MNLVKVYRKEIFLIAFVFLKATASSNLYGSQKPECQLKKDIQNGINCIPSSVLRDSKSLDNNNSPFSLDSLQEKNSNLRIARRENDRHFDQSTFEAELPLPTEVLDKLFSRVLFNTTMNYIVPMVEISFPLHTDQGSTVHLAMQAFLGLFSAIAWIATVAVPILLTGAQPFGIGTIGVRNAWNNFGKSFSFSKFNSLFDEKAVKRIGLDWETCLDKTICEAHRSPKKYGIIALPFLMFYPSSTEASDQFTLASNPRNKAAREGVSSELECGQTYHCFYDVLPLVNYLIHDCLLNK